MKLGSFMPIQNFVSVRKCDLVFEQERLTLFCPTTALADDEDAASQTAAMREMKQSILDLNKSLDDLNKTLNKTIQTARDEIKRDLESLKKEVGAIKAHNAKVCFSQSLSRYYLFNFNCRSLTVNFLMDGLFPMMLLSRPLGNDLRMIISCQLQLRRTFGP
jgi:hypothetical protein